MTPKTTMRVKVVPSLMRPGKRRWWHVWNAWGHLAATSMQAALESDYDYQERELGRLIGKEAAGRLREATDAFILGTGARRQG